MLSAEDLEQAAANKSRVIEILDFVKAEEVDDRYFEKPHYLLPASGGDRAYALLREAIRESGRLGIGKFVLRDKQHLAAIEAIGDALVLSTMRFRPALVKLEEYEFPGSKQVRARDLKLAQRLIDEFASEWDPDKYTDDYRRNIMEVIEARRSHQEPEIETQEAPQSAKVVDLMERLQASLGKAPSRKAQRPRRRKKTARSKPRHHRARRRKHAA